jgi:putative DNA primase/helicase
MNAAEQLARALGAVRSGRQWKCKCVSHEDRSPSMIIFDGRTGAVQVRCLAGCEPADIIAALKSRGLWLSEKLEQTSSPRKSVSHETVSNQHERRMRVLARCIFDEARPLKGTLGEKYFDSRDLWSVARDIPDIRFLQACPRTGRAQPAIVIAMRSIQSHAVTAVQRIFLTRAGKKDAAMMLGSASGAAMQLQPRSRELNICEGLETGLAIIAQDHSPVWAMGSTSLIQTFPLLDDVERLVIWADHDRLQTIGGKPCRPGHKAAGICEARWIEADKSVEVRIPKNEGWDQCDVWRSRCARL